MKAAIYKRYGSPDVIEFTELEKPAYGDDDVRVKVAATTVNRTDTGLRSAQYVISRLFTGLFKPRHQTQGCEYTGTIDAVGSNVSNFKVGDTVFAFNDEGNGGHAEFAVINSQKMIIHTPKGMSPKQIVAASEGAHYLLYYMRAANIKKGDRVLVHGGTGAIGSAGVQILSHIGAEVTATARKEHHTLMKKLGATRVIDYETTNYADEDKTYDVVFDSVGKSSFKDARRVLNDRGIYMSSELGKGGQNPLLALATRFSKGKKVLFPIPASKQEDLVEIRDYIEVGGFTPLIDREYDFEDIVEATKYVEAGQKLGNVVIKY